MKIRPDILAVGLILFAGFLLRLISINHGLPGIYHPDEPIVVSRAADLVINGKWNPKFFHWPSLLIYILALEYEIIYLIGFLIGKYKNSEEFFKFYLLNRGIFHLVGRVTVACMSAGLGYYLYLILRTMKSPQAGLIGLVLVECSFLLVKHGQYITPDIPAAFFATVSLYYLTRYHFADSSRRLLIWSGVFIGLGIASKYNYALMLIPLWIICLSKQDRTLRKRLSDLVLSSIAAILVFIITNPFILLDYPTFSFQFYEISRHLKEGHIGMEARGNASIDLLQHLIRTGGPVLFLSSLGGIILLLKRNFLFGVALIIFPLALIVSHGQWQVTADRYAVPLVPFVIIFASFIISFYLENKTKVKFIAAVVLLIIISQSLLLSFANCLENRKPDTREIARIWIEKNIPSGSRIGIEKNGPTLEHAASAYHREPSYYYFDITPWFGESFHGEAPMDLLIKNQPQYVIINSIVFDRYYPRFDSESTPPKTISNVYVIWRSYYDYLKNSGKLIYEISPGKDYTGPIVRIYRLPE
jgi:multisubunit Na+/H+ antiporter MnhB subunit